MSVSTEPRSLGRASYREIELYAPDRAPCRIDLSDNTNAWGMPPAAANELASLDSLAVARYPQLYAARLKVALAAYVGTSPDMIVTGCGSDDVLDSAIRAFGEPGHRVAFIAPTFPMIPTFARMNALIPVPIPLTSTYDADADALLGADARIIYLCSPNNPTGSSLTRATIEAVVDGARHDQVIIVDEAYAEYADAECAEHAEGSVVRLAETRDRLLVTRTMSKAFGLAGLRVGYAVGSPALVAEVEKSRGPYKVSAIAERVAVAALERGLPWVRDHVALACRNRTRLRDALARRGLDPIESAANFVLLPVANAGGIARAMRARGVAVRPFDGLPPISRALADSGGSALRFSIGPWEQLTEALDAFDEARRSCE